MPRIAGVLSAKIDGVLRSIKGNVEVGMGFPKREAIMNSQGKNEGYKETYPDPPYLQIDVINTSDVDLVALAGITNGTIVAELANGKVYSLQSAYHAEGGKINAEDATVPTRWEGTRMEEIR